MQRTDYRINSAAWAKTALLKYLCKISLNNKNIILLENFQKETNWILFLFSNICADAIWCVCRSDQSTPNLQKTIDYACGAGADCTPTKTGGSCSSPDTVLSHCSYAANSYFQKNGQAQTACNFSGTATISTTDPSKFLNSYFIGKHAENMHFHKFA